MNINHIKNVLRLKCRFIAAILMAAVMGPCFWSCTDDLLYNIYDEDDYDGEEISVPVTLSVRPLQSVNPQSRAVEYIEPTEDEKTIHDLWVIEYHENGTRIGLPRFYNEVSGNSFNLNIIVPR